MQDLLHPTKNSEAKKHKKKRLIQAPDSFYMDVKCEGCFSITQLYSHSQDVIYCSGCSTTINKPTGGKTIISDGFHWRKKPI